MNPTDPTGAGDPLDPIVADYLQRLEDGKNPDRAELLARHPELADRLGAFFADLDRMGKQASAFRLPDPDSTVGTDGATGTNLPRVRYLGDYELLEEIARGGMGVVYKARQVSLNRVVALKMILAGQLASEAAVQRFKQEAEAAAGLDHPNILPIYEVGEHEGHQYFSMKLVKPKSPGPHGPGLSVEQVTRVARAVHYAHLRGILHRDLKPSNILTDKDGTPYVTDFGLAKKVDADDGSTRTGAVVGTPAYMAPEQARGLKGLTTAVDVYSLGAILYETLTGRPPFQGDTVLDTLRQVTDCDPAHPSTVNPKADRDLAVIALKCLEKNPARRYASAAALADDLDRWRRGEPIEARPATRRERAVKWARRNPLVAALAGLGVFTSVAILGLLIVALQGFALAVRREADAQKAKNAAVEAGIHMTEERDRANAALYRARIGVAHAAWQGNEVRRAKETLAECPPESRGWEWHYLRRLCNTGLLTLGADRGTFRCVDFAPGCKLLAGGAADAVVVWEVPEGKEVRVLPGTPDRGSTIRVKFSPDGKLLAAGRGPAPHFDPTGGYGNTSGPSELIVWDWPAGTVRFRHDLDWTVGPPVFSPDSKFLIVPGFKNELGSTAVTILDAATGNEVRRLKDAGTFPVYSADGKTLYVGNGFRGTTVWDAANWERKPDLNIPADRAFACGPTSGYLAGVDLISGSAVVADPKTGQVVARCDSHAGPVQALGFDRNSELITGGADGRVRVWRADLHGRLMNTLNGHSGPVTGVTAGGPHDPGWVATAGGEVKLWDPGQGQEGRLVDTYFRQLPQELTQLWAGTARDDEDVVYVLRSKPDRPAMIWNARTRQEVVRLEARVPAQAAVHLNMAAGLVVVFGKDDPERPKPPPGGTLSVSDTRTGKVLRSTRLSRDATPALSPDGRRLLVSERGPRTVSISRGYKMSQICPIDEDVRVLDARTGDPIWSHKGDIWNAGLLPGDRVLLRTGAGERIDRLECLDGATGDEQWAMPVSGEVAVFEASADGRFFAFAVGGGLLEVRDLATGALVFTIPQETVGSAWDTSAPVAFTPDGSRLAVGRSDGSIRLWDTHTPGVVSEMLTLRGHRGPVTYLSLSRDGSRLTSTGADGDVRVWDATPVEEK
jgi:WD40 repeat protein